MKADAQAFAKKCDKCQKFASYPRAYPEKLCVVTTPWPFARWGVDLIGPLPTGRGGVKFAIVAVDYFTKWVEAKPLATITSARMQDFIFDNIICRFGIPWEIVTDNGTQFTDHRFKAFCDNLGIRKTFTSVEHPQANGQVEAINKILKRLLKTKLEDKKGAWVEELPKALWAYRTTTRTPTGETPFSMTYGVEAVIPVEIGLSSIRRDVFDPNTNQELLKHELDLLEEKRELAQLRNASYQQRARRYYNSKVRQRSFDVGDLVLRRVAPNVKGEAGTFGPNWEGPYKITRVIRPGTYKLETQEGKEIPRTWHASHLRRHYV